MSTPSIAVQARLWGLERVASHYTEVFDEIRQAGYAGVETRFTLLQEQEQGIADYLRRHPEFSLVALHAGLKGFDREDVEETLRRLLEQMNRVQTRYLLVSMGSEKEPEPWFELAAKISELCDEYGVTFCYHNHAAEFNEGTDFFDRLTGTYKVKLAADLAWVHRAGQNVTAFIDRYAESIRYIHVKDTLGDQWKELGEGEVPLLPILKQASALQLPWWTVEQDDTKREPLLSASISRDYLRDQFGL
ncbi:hypothetical protein PAESOLCIP111_01041 [Paenibacillus solanacearum]|uniref:Xylose isomerase-like TIM barrel domain-containing protein n=1 Tax=Paenibacillus solanacearum TaxID=2048548 RepID=A0A916NNJ7_9BACL|nr:sugar phosphate isomerase/epimerase [Paenibacillus solanacearum]CAG7608240.1 hypothetical protein PAESOLCIP111_01041 [Paenibacillus solanacearum]